jgi:predicted ArsR family transcriptional regulator
MLRLMTNTRDRILELLRLGGGQTVESLSTALKLTRTAITTHLAGLQAEGFVRRQGLRPGSRRPSIVYELTAAADALFPKEYDEFAATLVDEIKRKNPADLRRYLQRIADRWISQDLPHLQGLRGQDRLKRATDILRQRGFMPTLEQAANGYRLSEHNCPLMRLTVAHPEVCDMVHDWMEGLFDARLARAQCLREGHPSSTYTISNNPKKSRDSRRR